MQIRVKENINAVYQKIFKTSSFGSIIYKSKITSDSIFLVYEQYTIRNGNYMSVSVVLEPCEEDCMIHYVPSGSARGLLGFDFGASRSRMMTLLTILKNHQMEYQIIKE